MTIIACAGARQAVRVPVQLGRADGRVPGAGGRRAALLALPAAAGAARASCRPPGPGRALATARYTINCTVFSWRIIDSNFANCGL